VFWFYLGKLIWPQSLITFIRAGSNADSNAVFTHCCAGARLLFVVKTRVVSRPYFFAFIYYLLNLFR